MTEAPAPAPRPRRWEPLVVPGFLAALLTVFLPVEIVCRNPADYLFFSPLELLVPLALLGLLLALVLAGPLYALPPAWAARYEAAVAAAAFAAWLMGAVLPPAGGATWVLDGKLDLGGVDAASVELAALLVGFAAAAALVLALRFPIPARRFLGALGLLLAATAAVLIIRDAYRRQAGPQRTHDRVPMDALANVSADRAVIVTLMDSLQADVLETVLERRPDLRAAFDGFTVYRDATGTATTTALSMPVLHSGRRYGRGDVLGDVYEDTIGRGSVLNRLARAGWTVSLVNPVIRCPQDVAACVGLSEPMGRRWRSVVTEAASTLDLALFRVLPLAAKRAVHADGRWWLKHRFSGSSPAETLRFLDLFTASLRPAQDRPTFHFVHLFGTHAPALVAADCAPRPDQWSRENATDQAECVLGGYARFLEGLQRAGLYDSTLLVLVADHGAGFPHLAVTDPADRPFALLAGAANPALALKPPRRRGPVAMSDAPADLADLPGTLCLLEPACREGRPGIESAASNPDRVRSYQSYDWSGNWHRETPIPFEQFAIRGPLTDPASWHQTRRTAATRLEMAPSDPEEAYGYGWGPPERGQNETVRWVYGLDAAVYLRLPLGRPSTLRVQAGTLPSNPDQHIRVEVDGHTVGEHALNGWLQTLEYALPAELARPDHNEVHFQFTEANPLPDDPRPLSVVFDWIEVR